MKLLFTFIVFIHAAIHSIGFVKEWQLTRGTFFKGKTLIPLSAGTSKMAGILWLLTCSAFIVAGVAYLLKKDWWWMVAFIAVIISQTLIIIYWQDAKAGSIANIIILIVAIIAYANGNFNKMIQNEVQQMFKQNFDKVIITKEMLTNLPSAVQLWLMNCGIVGKENIEIARLKQKGLMRLKPGQDKWIEATAEQYFTTKKPAFIWKVNIHMMPMVPVTGRDKFVNGKGHMTIKLLSLVNIANESGEKIDESALQRYLAEICWFPSAALSPYIKWQSIDSTSAKATLTYNNISGSVIFIFNQNGDIAGCSAHRYKGGGKDAVREEWLVTTKKWATMNGIRIPVKSEATWKLKSGDFTWYKLEITEVEYNKLQLY